MKPITIRKIGWGAVALVALPLTVVLATGAAGTLSTGLAATAAVMAAAILAIGGGGLILDRAEGSTDAVAGEDATPTTVVEPEVDDAVDPEPTGEPVVAEEPVAAEEPVVAEEPAAPAEPAQRVMTTGAGVEIIEISNPDGSADVIVRDGERTTSVERIGSIIDAGSWDAGEPPSEAELEAALQRWGLTATTGDAA